MPLSSYFVVSIFHFQFLVKSLYFGDNGLFQFLLGDDKLIIGHTDRLGDAFECQFHVKVVLLCAEYDADGGGFAILTLCAVEQGKVVVHLARVFGFELAYLQVNGHQTAQFPVKEEHIYTAFLSVVLHCVLVANKSATARCTFSASGLFLFLP